jgi:hypothetical protein
MKPLRVVLIHSPSLSTVDGRAVYGEFAYPVPEFEVVAHVIAPRNSTTAFGLSQFRGQADLIIHEDCRAWASSYGPRKNRPPVAFRVLDSTQCQKHYDWRHAQCEQADLILLDMDHRERYADLGKPIIQAGFGLDEHLFADTHGKRDIDVAFLVGTNMSRVRPPLDAWLRRWCEQRGYAYVSGRPPLAEYVSLLNRAKACVANNRTPTTRSGRVFETLACGAVLVAEPIPAVEDEAFVAGLHYVAVDGLPSDTIHPDEAARVSFGPSDLPELAAALDRLVKDNRARRQIVTAGQKYVLANFTWAARATVLRAKLEAVL